MTMPRRRPIRERKHRLPRPAYQGEVLVAFTACTAHRNPGLATSSVVKRCVTFLAEATQYHRCTVPIYCFMPDHLHVMLWGQSVEADTWRAMVRFKQRSGYWLSQSGQSVRWQKDFYDHVLRPHEDGQRHVRYIAENPVRAGLVERWDQYPFSGTIGYDLKAIVEDMA
jgi:putative transposase